MFSCCGCANTKKSLQSLAIENTCEPNDNEIDTEPISDVVDGPENKGNVQSDSEIIKLTQPIESNNEIDEIVVTNGGNSDIELIVERNINGIEVCKRTISLTDINLQPEIGQSDGASSEESEKSQIASIIERENIQPNSTSNVPAPTTQCTNLYRTDSNDLQDDFLDHTIDRIDHNSLEDPDPLESTSLNNCNDDHSSNQRPKSCMSRRSSSARSSTKKRVIYSESMDIIPSPVPPDVPLHFDDDDVFSDSVSPTLPRGNMCAPFTKKRGSIPGLIALPDWFSENRRSEDNEIIDPPITPVGRDELALKRHRFFSDLITAYQAAIEHNVHISSLRLDSSTPIDGRFVDCNQDQKTSSAVELSHLIDRLEKLIDRLERTVSAKNLEIVNESLNHRPIIVDTQLKKSESLDNFPLPPTPLAQPTDGQSFDTFEDTDLDNIPTVIDQFLLDEVGSLTDNDEFEERDLPLPLPPSPSCLNMSVNGYQDIINGPLGQYVILSKQIGGDVAKHAELVERAFAAQLQYITLASQSAKPDDSKQMQLLKPTSDQISAIQEYREKNRVSPFFNHLSAISESIPALGWVCVAPTPGPHVKEMNDAGQFYSNRVLKDWKEKDVKHVQWANAWVQTLTELQQFIKQYHTTGLVWSGKTVLGSGGPPPPPPGLPPPPPMLPPLGDLTLNPNDDRSALFAQINKGEDITKGLKKITADMQTHKNTALRTGPAPFKAPIPAQHVGPVAPVVQNKAPVFVRDGKKWLIEYQKSNPNLIVENAEMNNVVYMFKCENSTLTVKGKINGIVIDSCKKCSILFDAVVASIEFVNCQSVQMQVLDTVPTISIDKTDGCQMYLSQKSLSVEIVSSKSSEMNVLIPKGNGDFTEQPIPEQYKTTIQGKGLKTVCVESLG